MPENLVKIRKEQDTFDSAVCCSDGGHYPWGLSLSVDDDMIEELGIGALGVGDVVEVRGFAFVDSKHEHSDKDSSNKSMRLQLTAIDLNRETDDRVKQLYGE